MKIEEKHIDFIESSLKFHGVKEESLLEDLVDHFCSYIESQDGNDFETLYQEALQKFGGYASFQNLQVEANKQKFTKEHLVLNRLKVFFGFTMLTLLLLGMLFKIMHWPYASSMLLVAILTFILGVLPVLFYARYRRSNYKFS